MQVNTLGRIVEADPTGNYLTTPHASWRLIDYGNGGMVSESPVFGAYMITPDRLVGRFVMDVFRTPLAMRTFDINQLSDLHGQSTIPNLTEFSTAAGNMEQLGFLEYCVKKLGGTERDLIAYIVAQSVTDASHSQLRHVGDMEVEGLSGEQKFHDLRRSEAYEYGGIADVMERYGLGLDEEGWVSGVAIPACVESKKPHLNADNYQYVLTEMYEWFAGYDQHEDPRVASMCGTIVERIKRLGRYEEVIDVDRETGHVVFKDPADALFFQKCQMLASTEDWKEPINRVLEHMDIQDSKYLKVERLFRGMGAIDNGQTLRPTAYTYYVDRDVLDAQSDADKSNDMYMHASRHLRRSISREERERFYTHKLPRYAEFLADDAAVDYPNEMINGNVVKFGLPSSSVEILEKQEVDPSAPSSNTAARLAPPELQSNEGVTYVLDPLKNRMVRPYVRGANGALTYLDKLDNKIGRTSARLLEQHQRLQWQRLTVRLVVTQGYAKTLRESFASTSRRYEELAGRPNPSPDQVRRMINGAADRARVQALGSGLLVALAA